jgi:hypothetical protein
MMFVFCYFSSSGVADAEECKHLRVLGALLSSANVLTSSGIQYFFKQQNLRKNMLYNLKGC